LEKLISDHASTEFHIIKLAKNYGYTGGNNRGAMYAHLHEVEYLFFMNDDIILLDKSLITTLIENLEKNKDIGAVQPLIINKGGSLNCGFQFGFHLYLK
jgi:GT2 family glycosyltransferase